MPSDPSASQISNLSDEDLLRIRRALGNLPYSAAVMHMQVHDVDSLVHYLNRFAEVLREHARRVGDTETELLDLQRQRDGFRRFLGMDEILARLDEVAPE